MHQCHLLAYDVLAELKWFYDMWLLTALLLTDWFRKGLE